MRRDTLSLCPILPRYLQGGIADLAVRQGKTDYLGESLEYIQQQGVPGGIGAHCLETVQACVDAGFKPDFWVKTLHHDFLLVGDSQRGTSPG